LLIIKGALPSVPTNEFVQKSAVHDIISIIGIYNIGGMCELSPHEQ
jgi:hypothetical protein